MPRFLSLQSVVGESETQDKFNSAAIVAAKDGRELHFPKM
jgi:hypothetical protein